ncbi:MAG: hypothetical protein K8F91_12885, partial [Candidatus Obscuribacterales bacterium]|nr:hypothetical protein [Candidatus Obscuribacterales bacterium]
LNETLSIHDQGIEKADKQNYQAILDSLFIGYDRKFQIKQNIGDIQPSSDSNALASQEKSQDLENWQTYERYLSPATTRAQKAFELIGNGQDENVRQGETLLLEAIKLRPELQFNKSFQQDTLSAYETMAGNRNGKPMLDFRANIPDLDARDNPILKQRLERFRDRITLDRSIAQTNIAGGDSSGLTLMRNQIASQEWNTYQQFLMPSTTQARQGFDLISSGDPTKAKEGRELLVKALHHAPELEFSQEFYQSTNRAYESYAAARARASTSQPAENPPIENGDTKKPDVVESPQGDSAPSTISDKAFMPPPLPDAWNKRWRERYHPATTPSKEQEVPDLNPNQPNPNQPKPGESPNPQENPVTPEPDNKPADDLTTKPETGPEDFKPPNLDDVEDFHIPDY